MRQHTQAEAFRNQATARVTHVVRMRMTASMHKMKGQGESRASLEQGEEIRSESTTLAWVHGRSGSLGQGGE